MSIFEPWPYFDDDEIDAVAALLRTGQVNYWTGPDGRAFEEEFAATCGCDRAIAVANGTVALDIALRALGIGSGDDVIVTPRSFIASASSVALSGARPIFADVDGESQNITAETIQAALTPQTKAVVCVHLAGWPCEMDTILELCQARGIKVIEDAAQAQGARYRGRPVGSLGDIAAFSFCQDKIMSTGGEGGMVVTNDLELWKSAWSFKDHGKDWDAVFNREHPPGFRWLHNSFGTNWRMTGMQAAIGRRQLAKLPTWVANRRANAAMLSDALRDLDAVRLPEPPAEIEHAYYKYYLFVRPDRMKPDWDRDRIMQTVVARGVPCFSGSCPEIYLEKAFKTAGLEPDKPLPVARELGNTSLMLLVHPTLSKANVERAASTVRQVIIEASR